MMPTKPHDPPSRGEARRCGLASVAVGILSAAALFASLFVSFVYLRSTERYRTMLELAGGRWVPGLTVILGDSIIQSVGDGEQLVANFAVSGGTIASTGEMAFETFRSRAVTHAILGVGINDLRSGRSPEAVAAELISLVRRLRAATTLRQIVVISILPIVEGAPTASRATNAAIDVVNSHLSEAARRGEIDFLDLSALFRDAAGLRPELTYDGLHLNDAGRARLRSIIRGLAHS